MNPYSGTPASAAEGSKWSAATLTFETQRGKKSSAGTAQTMWGWRDRVVHAHEVALGPEEQDHDQEEVEGAQGDDPRVAAGTVAGINGKCIRQRGDVESGKKKTRMDSELGWRKKQGREVGLLTQRSGILNWQRRETQRLELRGEGYRDRHRGR